MSRDNLSSYRDYIQNSVIERLDLDLVEYFTIVNVFNSKYGKDMIAYYYDIGLMGDEVVEELCKQYLSMVTIK